MKKLLNKIGFYIQYRKYKKLLNTFYNTPDIWRHIEASVLENFESELRKLVNILKNSAK